MLNMIYCEFLKLKRLKFFSTLLLMCAIFQLVLLFTENKGVVLSWNKYIGREEISSSFAFILVFVVVAAFLVSREFTDNTAKELYSYPTTRIKIFISKIIVTLMLIVITYMLKFCITIALGLIVPHENLTINVILAYLKVTIYVMIFQAALVPITVFITSLSRNLIAPIIYGIFLWILDVFAFNLGENVVQLIPSCLVMLPADLLLGQYNSTQPITPSMITIPAISILSALVTFIVGLILCVLYYKKADIA